MTDPTTDLVLALFAIGMALSFLAADPRSPTSRALCFFLCALGATFLLNVPLNVGVLERSSSLWPRLFSAGEGLIMAAAFEWILRIGRTASGGTTLGRSDSLLRVGQVAALLYAMVGIAFPAARQRVWYASPRVGHLLDPAFYLFAVPFLLGLGLAGAAMLRIARSAIDAAELVRLNAIALATPFLASGIFLGESLRPVTTAIGELIFLAGAVRYHVLQGQRAQFLGRFLSPELARLVREQGLASIMRENRVELSVVATDLRGFTAFAETAAPDEVMQLLRDYYETVGAVVASHGGSIKDFAGDGILALVGAPVPRSDHATRAVAMAISIRDHATEALSRRRRRDLALGVGVGVASGVVTVGTISGKDRLEYAAIGPTVNLAARLCARAEAEQVLLADETVNLLRSGRSGHRFGPGQAMELKGISRPVTVYAVAG